MSLENKQVKFSKVMGRVLVLVSSRYEFESWPSHLVAM